MLNNYAFYILERKGYPGIDKCINSTGDSCREPEKKNQTCRQKVSQKFVIQQKFLKNYFV